MREKWLETAQREKQQFGGWPSTRVPDDLTGKRIEGHSDEEKAALVERFKAMPAEACAPPLTKLFAVK